MGQILNFPVQPSRLDYKRAKRRSANARDVNQLDLFPQPEAQILHLESGLGRFDQALMLDERGDPGAADLYAKAIAEQDCPADAFCNLGIIESRNGNTMRAFNCFTSSLKHNPRQAEAHYNLGNLYFELNDFRLAQTHYEMAAEIDPTLVNVYFNLALVQAINNDFSAAVIALGKYRASVSEEEGRVAEKLLQDLKESWAAVKGPRLAST
jgi:Flp pilus assembly protein TadD